MDKNTDILHEAKRLRLLAAALELQHYTSTEANVLPIPGGDRVIAVGTPAQVAKLLPEVRDEVLEEVAEALDLMNDSSGDAAAYDQREQNIYELEREHAIADCAKAVRAMKCPAGEAS